jgi:anti-sigma regulatory factor (Ser/Thr protein kinase)
MSSLQQHHSFAHEALLYAGEDRLAEGALPFVEEGLRADEPVLVVLGASKLDRLRSELGPDAERVLFADMAEVGTNPARIIPLWRRFVERAGARPVRGIGEPIWHGRRPAELVESQRHESLLNLAFADASEFRLLCPYDTDTLPEAVIDEALRSHPSVVERDARRNSPRYRGLDAIAAPFDEPLPAPPAFAEELHFGAGTLDSVRTLVARRARDAGLDARRANDLVLAVNEVATNSVLHGGGAGILRVWHGAEWLLCELEDRGRIENPLVGREEPGTEEGNGRGLWIANQLCELVQVRAVAGGTVVRLHMRR